MTYTPPPVVADMNPYQGLRQGDPEVLRISQDLARTDVFRIRSVVMDYGFLNAAICRFVKHLYTVCEYNNYTITDRNTLIDYVLRSCPCIEPHAIGPTSSGPNGPGPIYNERPRASGLGSDVKGTSNVKRSRSRKQATPKGGESRSSGDQG